MTTLKELSNNIRNWATDRKIIPNSNIEAQYIKLCEEFGELSDSIRKNNKVVIIDSIGDMYIVATIITGLLNTNIEELDLFQNEFYNNNDDNIKQSFFWLANSLGDIGKYIVKNRKDNIKRKLADLVNDLQAVAILNNTTLEQCVLASYEEIKNRKGYLRNDGIFIKESDYTDKDLKNIKG